MKTGAAGTGGGGGALPAGRSVGGGMGGGGGGAGPSEYADEDQVLEACEHCGRKMRWVAVLAVS